MQYLLSTIVGVWKKFLSKHQHQPYSVQYFIFAIYLVIIHAQFLWRSKNEAVLIVSVAKLYLFLNMPNAYHKYELVTARRDLRLGFITTGHKDRP